MPRIALWLFTAAYVLPGLFGRDPWKAADITAFGYMAGIANGRTSWLAPTIGGLPSDGTLLPYWIGAVFIKLFGGWVDPAFAARLPFAILLTLALVLTWYVTYHLARSEAAQPLPFAFGGEAAPVDYARAIADGALLALIASLGLLQLGHETTPELAQLVAVGVFLYALAAAPARPARSRAAALLALPMLAASGAPSVGVALGVVGVLLALASHAGSLKRLAPWLAASTLLAAGVATLLGAWDWRLDALDDLADLASAWRGFFWFTWPAWPLVLWTLWRWRSRWASLHIAVPSVVAAFFVAVWLFMGGADRVLMLALPAFAVLAAFALPTLQRSASAAIDWFSVFFFSIAAATAWVIYASIQVGVPAKPARNIARLSPGFSTDFSAPALLFALAATLAWVGLVAWRAGRQRHPLWKSMVLPAGGVALCWTLVMTLLLAPLDNARSYRSQVQRIARWVPPESCVAAPGMSRAQVAALEYLGRYRVDASTPAAAASRCRFLLIEESLRDAPAPQPGWQLLGRERRNRRDTDSTTIYRRADTAAGAVASS
nr:hypothetical protein [Schlegelella koreensis]